MARPKKNREVSIVHFSFFDLLFGAFGAFVFLMIMQVLSTLNMVDVDIQKLVDETVQKKVALTKELEKYKETDQLLQNIQQKYDQAMNDRNRLIQEKKQVSEKADDLEVKLASLQREVNSLKQIQERVRKKGNVIKAMEEENKMLGRKLDEAKRKLSAIKTVPLKIKIKSFPTTITEEEVYLALAAEGGLSPYTWDLNGKLPRGLSFNKATGTIFGVVKSAGNYNFKVKVTDARGLSVETKNNISFNVIRKYEEPKSKVPFIFLILALVLGLYWLNSRWQKRKNKKYIEKMKAQGYEIKWVKPG